MKKYVIRFEQKASCETLRLIEVVITLHTVLFQNYRRSTFRNIHVDVHPQEFFASIYTEATDGPLFPPIFFLQSDTRP
jgi:hypothetical protein